MGHQAQERASRPKVREGSHPPPQHRLYPGAAMNQRYKERPEGASRRTHYADAAQLKTPPSEGQRMNLRDRIGVDVGRKLPLEEAIAWAADNRVRFVDVQLDAGANALGTIDRMRA